MSEQNPSGWAIGYASFAAFMLFIAGTLQFFAGLAAILDDEYFVVGEEYAFKLDTTAWGWIHLVVGIIVFCSGLGILKGHVLGRIVGVLAACACLLATFLWLPYQPVWSTVIIAVCIGVIWALTVHGRDVNALRD